MEKNWFAAGGENVHSIPEFAVEGGFWDEYRKGSLRKKMGGLFGRGKDFENQRGRTSPGAARVGETS